MPFTRISILKGKSPDQIRAIADGVHHALVEAFKAPLKDRFQIVEQRTAETLIYDKDYLGIERTDDLVVVHITAGRWRDTAQKQALYRIICERLSVDAQVRPEDVLVYLTLNDKDDWSFGNGIASYVPNDASPS